LLNKEIVEYFKDPASPTLIITVGNNLRADDGAGPYIASKLEEPPAGTLVLDAGENPENIVDDAVELFPARAVMIDAADFGGTPGEVRFIPDELIPDNPLSTHAFPLPVITKIIRKDARCNVRFLGIQVKTIEMGADMSPEVTAASDELVKLILRKK